VLLDIENIVKAVGILMLTRVQAEIYVILYLLRVPNRHLWYFTHSDIVLYWHLSHYVVRCKRKICGFRWNFTYIPSAMSGLSVSGFTSAILISGWTRIELCTGRCCGILKNKQSNVEFTSKDDLRPVIQWSTSLSGFRQKIIHPTFTSADAIR